MKVGDTIRVTNLSTGETHEARIVGGSPAEGLYEDDRGYGLVGFGRAMDTQHRSAPNRS